MWSESNFDCLRPNSDRLHQIIILYARLQLYEAPILRPSPIGVSQIGRSRKRCSSISRKRCSSLTFILKFWYFLVLNPRSNNLSWSFSIEIDAGTGKNELRSFGIFLLNSLTGFDWNFNVISMAVEFSQEVGANSNSLVPCCIWIGAASKSPRYNRS